MAWIRDYMKIIGLFVCVYDVRNSSDKWMIKNNYFVMEINELGTTMSRRFSLHVR